MKIILRNLLYLLCLIPMGLFAQSVVIGSVIDSNSGIPLPGVNIAIEGTSTGTVSDFDGNFILEKVKQDQIIVFEYVGFVIQKITYQGQKKLNVKLIEDVSKLNEVLVIGYGSSKKQDVTGSVNRVSEKEFNQGGIVSPEQLISGKTAGVRITSAGGAPGAGSQIRIRGGASLTGNSDPLIVVDGIPLDQRGVQGVRNQLNAINPNEIQDFVVLKDAAATAIYGSRASNGVILITTKKGKRDTPLQVEIDSKTSIGKVVNTVDVLNAKEFRELVTDNGADEALLGNSDTDWQDKIYRIGTGSINNITLSKGFKNSTVRLNYNNIYQTGILKTDRYRKNALNLAATQSLLNNNLKLTLTSKGIINKNDFANNNAINTAVKFDPTQSILDTQGNYFEFKDGTGLEVNAPGNPIALLEQDNNSATSKRNITNFTADYSIPYVPGLRFNLNLGFDYAEVKGTQYKDANIKQNDFDLPFNKTYSGINRNQLLDFYFNYKKDISAIKSIIDITAGYSYQTFYEDKQRSEPLNGEFRIIPEEINKNILIGYFGRASFDIAERYLISASVRRDGSSRFAEANQFGIFPAVSLGWKINNEKFLVDSKTISELKLRAGWGITGQQQIPISFGFLGIYTPGEDNARVQFGDEFVNTLRPEGYNTTLKWEESENINFGLDFGLFNDRVSGSFDIYQKETTDLLAEIPLPAGSNLTDRFIVNSAETKSSGVEFAINGDIIKKENFNWNLGYNITYNEREVVKLTLSDNPDSNIPQGGISGGVGNNIQLWKPGYDPTTFFVNKQIYDGAGNPVEGAYLDLNGDNEITDADKSTYKKATPDVYMGLTSNMEYKNFDFNFTFRGSFGGYNYNNVQSDSGNIATALNTPGNYYQNGSTAILETNFQKAQLFSDYYVQSADFIKLDNLSVGYNFKAEKFTYRLSITATNVFTITDYDGLDPEIYTTDVIAGQKVGIDDKFYPRPRTFVLGFNIKF